MNKRKERPKENVLFQQRYAMRHRLRTFWTKATVRVMGKLR